MSGCNGADTLPRPLGQAPGYPWGPWRRRGTPEERTIWLLCACAGSHRRWVPASQLEQRGAAGTALHPGRVRAGDPRPRPGWHGAGSERSGGTLRDGGVPGGKCQEPPSPLLPARSAEGECAVRPPTCLGPYNPPPNTLLQFKLLGTPSFQADL